MKRTELAKGQTDFNSIKVRLEQKIEGILKGDLPYFNSIKVRLEPNSSAVIWRRFRFQFHKGTIRTSRVRRRCASFRDFNSIKVRLEQVGNIALNPFPLYFNSIKVRLEHSAVSQRQRLEQAFQFHKGTIRTATVLSPRSS